MTFTEEEEEILSFLRSEQESYYRGDFEAFISHWHHGPEVRRILSGPTVGTRVHRGWDDLRTRFEEGFRQYPQHFDASELLRWDNILIQTSAEMAWVSYDQIATRLEPNLHAAPLSHETKIVQRFDGEWKLICLIVVAPGLGREDIPRIELQANGEVIHMNALAEARVASHQGLTISAGRPRALNRAYDPGLQAAISACKRRLATNLPRGFLNEHGRVVPLGEDEEGKPMFCWASCEQERIVLAFDDGIKLRGSLESAADSFGLSPAQLNVVERLASGQDLAGAAEALGVSVHTVRTQLRRMFEKTQTHNQAELITRLLNAQSPD